MHQVTREEELSHIYQLALDFCAKLSLRSRDEIGQIRTAIPSSGAGRDTGE
jgi:hypothetical protein